MKKVTKFVREYGLRRLFILVVYPLTLLVWSPIRFTQAIWDARILAEGKWSQYIGFDVVRSINYLFYWSVAVNIDRFGRRGISKYQGLGDLDMSRQFMYALPSLYAYRSFGAVLPIICMFGWWSMHILWVAQVEVWYVGVVVMLGLLSTKSYAATFSYQNYNVLGWVFYPLGLWGMLNEQYWIAGVAWLFASFGSITVVAVASFLSLIYAVHMMTLYPVLCVLPAVIKVVTHLKWSSNTNTTAIEKLFRIAKAIGMVSGDVKYKRHKIRNISTTFLYFLVLYLSFAVAWYILIGNIPILWLGAVGLYIINTVFMRFADDQSIYMTMLGLSAALALTTNSLLMLFIYWLVVSPLPAYLPFREKSKYPDMPPRLRPFKVQTIIDKVSLFLSPVKKDQRVLMAFNDPMGEYNNVFDGYRRILEVPLYVASLKKIHFFPDWWAVFDTNYKGAPEFWGRSIEEVNENIQNWKCDYVVVYQETGSKLEKHWENTGYKVLEVLDWGDCKGELRGVTPWRGDTPKWWLLKAPEEA